MRVSERKRSGVLIGSRPPAAGGGRRRPRPPLASDAPQPSALAWEPPQGSSASACSMVHGLRQNATSTEAPAAATASWLPMCAATKSIAGRPQATAASSPTFAATKSTRVHRVATANSWPMSGAIKSIEVLRAATANSSPTYEGPKSTAAHRVVTANWSSMAPAAHLENWLLQRERFCKGFIPLHGRLRRCGRISAIHECPAPPLPLPWTPLPSHLLGRPRSWQHLGIPLICRPPKSMF